MPHGMDRLLASSGMGVRCRLAFSAQHRVLHVSSTLHQNFARLCSQAASFVHKRPRLAVGSVGCATGAIGDGLAQSASNDSFDFKRWLGVTSFSAFDSLVLYLPFYRFLDMQFGACATVRSVAAKVVLDDICFVPLVEVPLFLTWTSIVEADSLVSRLRSNYKDTIQSGWAFNIPISIITFTLVPPAFRVPFADIADLGWSTLLSYTAHL